MHQVEQAGCALEIDPAAKGQKCLKFGHAEITLCAVLYRTIWRQAVLIGARTLFSESIVPIKNSCNMMIYIGLLRS